jgi:hypothetical protein
MKESKPQSKDLDYTAQLVMLKDMTRRFGTLHSAQVLQLRLWPFTVDTTLDNANAKVDIEGKRVEYVWTGSKMDLDKKYQFRLNTLNDNVKFLLGNDWSMTVVCDGTTIFPLDTKNVKSSNRSGNSAKRKRLNGNRKPKRAKRKLNGKGRARG